MILLRVGVLKERRRGGSNRHQLTLSIRIAKDHIVPSIDQTSHSNSILISSKQNSVSISITTPAL